ncbi:MOSC domain protein [Phyllosticta capitalensis]
MKISQIYQYPIKALRPTSNSTATITAQGFKYDRRYMLLHVQPDGSFKNVHVANYPEATLFTTSMTEPAGEDDRGTITVTYNPPKGEELKGKPDAPATLTIPLVPDMTGLKQLEVIMHQSPTRAYEMGSEYSGWFSKYFGFEVILAYLGPHGREVLMSRPERPRREKGQGSNATTASTGSWLSSITSLTNSLPSMPFLGRLGGFLWSGWAGGATRIDPGSSTQHADVPDPELTFADCAAYLVVSATSLDELSSRIPGDYNVDVTKFRPNLIVEGCALPWDEDFWGEMTIATDSSPVTMSLEQNCARCPSINIDYSTGAPGKGLDGQVLKSMQRDRRVDRGAKWNPVFGRYGFTTKSDIGKMVKIGDEVQVTRRIEERTRFDWPGIYGN